MKKSVEIFGYTVIFDWTILLMVLLLSSFYSGFMIIVAAVTLIASVLLHEFGHGEMAKHYKKDVSQIEMGMLGGAASITKIDSTVYHAFPIMLISLAGPAVSFVIAALATIGYVFTSSSILLMIAQMNTMLLVFNMLPIFPMDGGRAIFAILCGLTRKITSDKHSWDHWIYKAPKIIMVGISALSIIGYATFSIVYSGLNAWTFIILGMVSVWLFVWARSSEGHRVHKLGVRA